MANALGPGHAPGVVVRSGIWLIIDVVVAGAGAEHVDRRLAQVRARSALVMTNAPAPSVTRQQSSRCSGLTCSGEASTSSIVIGSR